MKFQCKKYFGKIRSIKIFDTFEGVGDMEAIDDS